MSFVFGGERAIARDRDRYRKLISQRRKMRLIDKLGSDNAHHGGSESRPRNEIGFPVSRNFPLVRVRGLTNATHALTKHAHTRIKFDRRMIINATYDEKQFTDVIDAEFDTDQNAGSEPGVGVR
jgi:hypothetical protein